MVHTPSLPWPGCAPPALALVRGHAPALVRGVVLVRLSKTTNVGLLKASPPHPMSTPSPG